MKIAVAGCNGRVGSRVVKLALERCNDVVGIDITQPVSRPEDSWLSKPEYTFKQINLEDFDAVVDAFEGCDAVISLAACPNPADYKVVAHNKNVIISWNILRACAELGINRVAQASSVNVIAMDFSKETRFYYFPIDEDHPCEPDEPYGLSKLICEMQADSIIRRYKAMKIATLRLHWSIPSKAVATRPGEPGRRSKDLWGYIQEDSGADAFLLAIEDNDKWSGHERFFIVAPEIASEEDTTSLIQTYWKDVPIKEGKTLTGRQSLFDCSKAVELLGWCHRDAPAL